MLKKKAFIAGAVLAMLVSTSISSALTTTVYAEGMAYRERQEQNNRSLTSEERAHRDQLEKTAEKLEREGKYDRAQKTRKLMHDLYGGRSYNRNDDQDGRNAFNRTHGRGNEDGSDGMAWREKRDQERREERERQRQERQERRERERRERRERQERRNEDKNGMDAFNRTHGR